MRYHLQSDQAAELGNVGHMALTFDSKKWVMKSPSTLRKINKARHISRVSLNLHEGALSSLDYGYQEFRCPFYVDNNKVVL